jgi:hypothetical protein
MDGGGSNWIEEGLQNGRWEVNIRGNMKERGGKFFLICNFLVVCNFQTIKLIVDGLRYTNDLAK